MPLRNLPTSSYLTRTRVYVDSDKSIVDQSKTGYSFTVDLETEMQNVVSVELVNYALHKNMVVGVMPRYILDFRPFADAGNTLVPGAGASMVDVEIFNPAGSTGITFPLDLENVGASKTSYGGRNLTKTELETVLQAAIPYALDSAGHASLNTTNYTLQIGFDEYDRFYFYMYATGSPSQLCPIRFLFETGDNEANSMHRLLGFDKADTVPDATTNGVLGTYAVDTRPFKYIDVLVNQVKEFDPLARIFVGTDTDDDPFIRPRITPDRPRFLIEPIKKLKQLTVTLRLQDEQEPNIEVQTGFDLHFEILSLTSDANKPDWVQQTFYY